MMYWFGVGLCRYIIFHLVLLPPDMGQSRYSGEAGRVLKEASCLLEELVCVVVLWIRALIRDYMLVDEFYSNFMPLYLRTSPSNWQTINMANKW